MVTCKLLVHPGTKYGTKSIIMHEVQVEGEILFHYSTTI